MNSKPIFLYSFNIETGYKKIAIEINRPFCHCGLQLLLYSLVLIQMQHLLTFSHTQKWFFFLLRNVCFYQNNFISLILLSILSKHYFRPRRTLSLLRIQNVDNQICTLRYMPLTTEYNPNLYVPPPPMPSNAQTVGILCDPLSIAPKVCRLIPF